MEFEKAKDKSVEYKYNVDSDKLFNDIVDFVENLYEESVTDRVYRLSKNTYDYLMKNEEIVTQGDTLSGVDKTISADLAYCFGRHLIDYSTENSVTEEEMRELTEEELREELADSYREIKGLFPIVAEVLGKKDIIDELKREFPMECEGVKASSAEEFYKEFYLRLTTAESYNNFYNYMGNLFLKAIKLS